MKANHMLMRLSFVIFVMCLTVSCTKTTTSPAVPGSLALPTGPVVPPGPPFFEEVTGDRGIPFTYRNGEEAGHLAILESLGGGIGLIDYDGDGLLDVFVPGGGYFDGPDKKDIRGYPCKLYKNLGNFKFRDVTEEVGLKDFPWFYSHAVAVGDYDRDGWPDLLVTGWGRVALFHNESVDKTDPSKGRKFVDVTEAAGLKGITWATSAAWGDLDGDGYPDLYICQYVDWSFKNHPTDCSYEDKTRDICKPARFSGLPHKLLRNNGNATFTDISKEVGLDPGGPDTSKGLGVLFAAMRGSGRPDIYVANDTVPKFLYVNDSTPGNFKFRTSKQDGLMTGAVLDGSGAPNGSMGLAAGDFDGSGKLALVVSNYEGEMNALYQNRSTAEKVRFNYYTEPAGLGAISQVHVGWGTSFLDVDHHGWEDLFFANGHAIRYPKTAGVTLAQRPLFLRNVGGKFQDYSVRGGDYFQKTHRARGAAFGDLNNDGRTSIIVSHLNEPIAVLRNIAEMSDNHWVGVVLQGKDNADVVGAKVSLVAGERTLTRFAVGGGSYASSSDLRHLFGLGKADKVGRLTVTWPNGKEQTWDADIAVDGYNLLTQGQKNAEKWPRRR